LAQTGCRCPAASGSAGEGAQGRAAPCAGARPQPPARSAPPGGGRAGSAAGLGCAGAPQPAETAGCALSRSPFPAAPAPVASGVTERETPAAALGVRQGKGLGAAAAVAPSSTRYKKNFLAS